jgi:hypothetical protein
MIFHCSGLIAPRFCSPNCALSICYAWRRGNTAPKRQGSNCQQKFSRLRKNFDNQPAVVLDGIADRLERKSSEEQGNVQAHLEQTSDGGIGNKRC